MLEKNVRKRSAVSVGKKMCKDLGFVEVGANLYRCYGQGLLQVVTFRGFPERVNTIEFNREAAVKFGVYSLYQDIFWVMLPLRPRRDLVPSISPSILNSEACFHQFLGTEYEAGCMIEYGIPFLNRITTHADFAQMIEQLDMIMYKKNFLIDGQKIVPYILSGQRQNAVDVINAIEEQSWDCYESNCLNMKDYDKEGHRRKLEKKLEPLLQLRSAALSGDAKIVNEYLQTNYRRNVQHLQDMGVSVGEDCVVEQLL
ncbi:MAG: hypothetical protein IJZ85_07375 [Lachnospiraceae bacterium]|nr:hypothetical protein [Lachnospiraceae bacterium]